MFKIESLDKNNRLSTQELLQIIYEKMEEGVTEFEIDASGQHDIGGPLWNQEGKQLKFVVRNAGQRLGSMCLENTTIIHEGSVSADAGWLNAGGEIIIKGDGGDTTAHCAASGKIYVGGRVGTRSGSLMKYDPAYDRPEFWILKNTGSFSFEFMGGGIAVVCGIDSEEFDSVLGDRPCVGMVGGTLYYRGKYNGADRKDVKVLDIDDEDFEFLKKGIPNFLKKVDAEKHEKTLLNKDEWKKIIALTYEEKQASGAKHDIKSFRLNDWVQDGGIFGDVLSDTGEVKGLVGSGRDRLRIPRWDNAMYSAPCEDGCPAGIPSQTRFNMLRSGNIEEAYKLVLEYTPFPGSVCGSVCPNLCMEACTRCYIDAPAQIKDLGLKSAETKIDAPPRQSGKKVAVIGSGVAGLSAAWILALRGHGATVFEEDDVIGGKIKQAIPEERLPRRILDNELQRIQDMGVVFQPSTKVDKAKFEQLEKDFDAVVIATGAHIPKVIPFPGKERLIKGLDFLKDFNKGKKAKLGDKVVVIGCGNAGMDVIAAAYGCGAKEVLGVDIQKPLAFQHEIEHVEAMGAQLRYPVFTKEITEKGLITKDGELIEADTVIIAIGEVPDLDFLPEKYQNKVERGYISPDENGMIDKNIFVIGDVKKQGLLVDAIAHGRDVALLLNDRFNNVEYAKTPKPKAIPKDRLSIEYFSKCSTECMPDASEDHLRCISCGTCRDCKMCLEACPENAIYRKTNDDGTFEYVSDAKLCIGCGICKGICPCGIWSMYENAIKFGIDSAE